MLDVDLHVDGLADPQPLGRLKIVLHQEVTVDRLHAFVLEPRQGQFLEVPEMLVCVNDRNHGLGILGGISRPGGEELRKGQRGRRSGCGGCTVGQEIPAVGLVVRGGGHGCRVSAVSGRKPWEAHVSRESSWFALSETVRLCRFCGPRQARHPLPVEPAVAVSPDVTRGSAPPCGLGHVPVDRQAAGVRSRKNPKKHIPHRGTTHGPVGPISHLSSLLP